MPVQWVATQRNIAKFKEVLADRAVESGQGEALRREALAHTRDALAVFEEAGASHYAEVARERLTEIEGKM